jgi:hypothetical protein
MKVRIIDCNDPNLWYRNLINKIVEVEDRFFDICGDICLLSSENKRKGFIHKDDIEVINE